LLQRLPLWVDGTPGDSLSNALRKVRYHAVDADGKCVLDVTWTVCRIDEHKKTCSVECIDETAGGCVVPEADM
jgi:hypothetical protein